MDTTAAVSALRALASGDQRSAAARLRDLFDEVEAAIGAGVRREDVRDTLARHGLDMPFASFVRTLARIRKERGIATQNAQRPTPPSPPEAGPEQSRAETAPNPIATEPHALAVASATPGNSITPAPGERARRTIAPVGASLPDDWLTADLTREQKRLLTHEQRRARADAVVKDLWPNPFDPVPPKKEDPA